MDTNNRSGLFQQLYQSIPVPTLLVDEDVAIIAFNRAASELLQGNEGVIIQERTGDTLHCLNANLNPLGCGHSEFCSDCAIRNSVSQALDRNETIRLSAQLETERNGKKSTAFFYLTATPFFWEGSRLVLLMLHDLRAMGGSGIILSICAQCKQIRCDHKNWCQMETFLSQQMDIRFSHTICPACSEEIYPGLND